MLTESRMNAPLVWTLTGRNAGDNAQALALATDVATNTGGATVEIPLRFNLMREAPNKWLGASLASLSSARPEPPWPDLVIGVGRRAVSAARWIQAQSGAKLVWLGRPRAAPALFDLLLTTPQYGVPDGPNVIRMSLPYGPSQPDARPVAPLMVIGGDSWANRLTPRTLDNLAACVARVEPGAGLRITSSPRTPDDFIAALASRFHAARIHKFGEGDNPYREWLAEASACIVTGDSVSLIADAVATGAPVFVAQPDDAHLIGALGVIAPTMAQNWLSNGGNRPLLAPPPYPAAVVDHLARADIAEIKEGFTIIKGAKASLAIERAAALKRAVALLG